MRTALLCFLLLFLCCLLPAGCPSAPPAEPFFHDEELPDEEPPDQETGSQSPIGPSLPRAVPCGCATSCGLEAVLPAVEIPLD